MAPRSGLKKAINKNAADTANEKSAELFTVRPRNSTAFLVASFLVTLLK